MASPADKKSFSRLQVDQGANTEIIPKLPTFKLPEIVKQRFPELVSWETEHNGNMEAWRQKANIALRGGNL